MKEFMKNWINFFHKSDSELNVHLLYSVYEYIISFTPGARISYNDLKSKINADFLTTDRVLLSLIEYGLLQPHFKCPFCESDIENFIITNASQVINCKNCEEELPIRSMNLFSVTENASYKSYIIKKLEDESYELNAELLSQIGNYQHKLYYMITDIVGSHKKQMSDNTQYVADLHFLWHHVWPNVTRICKKPLLPLLAKGDAVSLVFADISDAIDVVINLPRELSSRPNLQLSAYVREISFSSYDRKGFVRSLDKKWDLNTESVTELYRISAQIKPGSWKQDETDYKLQVVFLDFIDEDVFNNKDAFNNFAHEETSFIDKHENVYTVHMFAGKILF